MTTGSSIRHRDRTGDHRGHVTRGELLLMTPLPSGGSRDGPARRAGLVAGVRNEC